MNSQELYEQILEQWEIFEPNHKRFAGKKIKAAGARARRAMNEIRKLASKYRTASIAESKEKKEEWISVKLYKKN